MELSAHDMIMARYYSLTFLISRKFIKHQQGKKPMLSTNRERRPFCTAAGKEDPEKLVSCLALLRDRLCSIDGSGNMQLKYTTTSL